jgi:hypothetical protein
MLWSAVLASIVVGPMAGRGWVLLLDWVTGPRASFGDRIWSGASLPAGPLFFGPVAVLDGMLGATAGWMVPWLTLVIAGLGGARLAGRLADSRAAALTGATAASWNPFMHERLVAGQLAMLLCAAFLPHLAASTADLVRGATGAGELRRPVLACAGWWAACAAASVHGVVLGAVLVGAGALVTMVTLGVVAPGGRARIRRAAGALGAATLLTGAITAMWLVPRAGAAPVGGDRSTVMAFATRPDSSLGLLGGVALQRGFWRASPGAPGSDLGWWWPTAGGVLGGAAILGLAIGVRRGGRTTTLVVASVGLAAGGGWLLGTGPTGPIGGVVTAVVTVPGLRVMREAGKFIALVPLIWTVGLALLADAATRWLPTSRPRASRLTAAVAVLGAAAPAALTPGLAWGVGGRLAAVRYPDAWAVIAGELAADQRGALVRMPFTAYLDPGFTGGRIVRDPARVYFGDRAVLSDDPLIAGLRPSARTAAIAAALDRARTDDDGLERLGIGWVIVRRGSGRGHANPDLGSLERVLSRDAWELHRVRRPPG